MIETPKKLTQVIYSKSNDPHAKSDVDRERNHETGSHSKLSEKSDMAPYASSEQSQSISSSPMEGAFYKSSKISSATDRFKWHLNRQSVDAASGRIFSELLNLQRKKYRPLIIARCLCNKHVLDVENKNKFIHPEFIEGSVAFEEFEFKVSQRTDLNKRYSNYEATPGQVRQVQEFVSKDIEFWAVNPLKMSIDVVANRSSLLQKKTTARLPIQMLLMNDSTPFDEEEESDHSFAYVVAGLYHSGHIVQKDQDLAKKSVALIKEADLPNCQADALRFAVDVDLDVFASLLTLGVDPNEQNEQGWSMIEMAQLKLSGAQQQAVLAVLAAHGFDLDN